MTGLIGSWGDALSLSKFLASPDHSGSFFVGSGSSPGLGVDIKCSLHVI